VFALDLTTYGRHVCFHHPDAIKDIFVTHARSLEAGAGNEPLRALLGDQSLLTLDGPRHRTHRKLLMPAFHGPRMRLYGATMQAEVEKMCATWPRNQPTTIYPSLLEMSLAVILDSVFGFRDPMRKHDLETLVVKLLHKSNISLRFFERFDDPADQADPNETLEWVRQRSSRLDALLYQEIEQRRALPSLMGDDVLSMMLRARDEDGAEMSAVEVHDELLTLLVAGHETTAAALAWTLSYLAATPAAQHACQQAVDALGPSPSPDALASCEHLRAVCHEGLRIMPPIPVVSRAVSERVEIAGVAVEPPDRIMACIYLTHHRADIYAEPDVFRPERFEGRSYTRYEYLPFGGGPRRCIGAAFAMHELCIALGTIMSRLTLSLPSGAVASAVRSALLVVPAGSTEIVVCER
jgi:cytochrome P450